jgi:hypothetical protein
MLASSLGSLRLIGSCFWPLRFLCFLLFTVRPCITAPAEHNTGMQRTIGYFWRFYFTLASEGPPVICR